ncbi:MAG: GTPase [Vibrionaceae bacterium]
MDKQELLQLLPAHAQQIDRLLYLKSNASKPRIAVFGKYNHGKSTLLNALVGKSVFKAADKRETIENKELEQEQLIWIDTPGLDADVHKQDDQAAIKGAFEMADFLFLVHQAQAGELDKYEMHIFEQLAHQDKNYGRRMFLVLTQIDQKTPEDVAIVEEKIRQQLRASLNLRDLKIIPVSAQRYNRGIEEDKAVFCENSGMQALFSLTKIFVSDIDVLRQQEIEHLKSQLLRGVAVQKETLSEELNALRSEQNNELHQLKKDVKTLSAELV